MKRVLLGASHSVIEPLGLLHLGGLARDEGWERQYVLVRDHDFERLFETVRDFKPDVVGFNVYTGNHLQLAEAFKRLRQDYPSIATVVGGPHPTYFPAESAEIADFVVMSEGFGSLRKILRGNAAPGIIPMQGTEKFPHPDRATFYEQSPEHANSPIKSFIGMTGCPYACTYCYNSSKPEDIAASPEVIEAVKQGLSLDVVGDDGCGEKKLKVASRLFPFNVRLIEDVTRETREIAENWPTNVLYCQDDVHGFNLDNIVPLGIPYHAQMRWEMTIDTRRLDKLRDAGCFGLTLAIEAADRVIRKEVLDRAMPEEMMFAGMRALKERGFLIRTEQITGLPYGATSVPTAMNLDADLELVELNVRLRAETNGPDMAWASTLAPYKGTKLGTYCEQFGHYVGNNSDVPDTFFDKSVLRFPREWIGPTLEQQKNNEGVWLSPVELETYRSQNAELRRWFNFFTLIPQGHVLAKRYLTGSEPFSYERIGRETVAHLEALGDEDSRKVLEGIGSLETAQQTIVQLSDHPDLQRDITYLTPVFAALPKGELALKRARDYALRRNGDGINPKDLSTAIRHHLYDEVLYHTGHLSGERSVGDERYAPKV